MSPAAQKSISLKTKDGVTLAATLIPSSSGSTERIMVIGSALGVPRYFYFKLAHFFAENGIAVITFDYRGIYESVSDTLNGSEMKMEHWGSRDIEAALQYAEKEFSPDELFYLGHSCGGQLIGLAPSCSKVDKMIFVACQQGDWRLWPWPYNVGVYLTWKLLRAGAALFDYVPTRLLGISSLDLPAGVARQWARWGQTPDYLFNPVHHIDTARYGKMEVPLLSFSFDDDIKLAPPKAVKALLEKYQSAAITRRQIDPETYNQDCIGHWGFFKERMKDPLWHEALQWIKKSETAES